MSALLATKLPLDRYEFAAVEASPNGTGHSFGSCFVPCASVPALPWHCVYTKPQMELRTEHKLRNEGAASWLPMQSVTLPNRQRHIRPLFPRYLFMQMTGERLRWGYVIRNLAGEELGAVMRSPSGAPLVVPTLIVEALFEQCAPNGVIYPPEPREMRRGDRGKVQRLHAGRPNPLADFVGICSRTTRDRVWLLLSVLGRPTEVAFHRDAVELVAT